MYFATYFQEGDKKLGLVYPQENRILALDKIIGGDSASNMLDFIGNCNEDILKEISLAMTEGDKYLDESISLNSVRLGPPICKARRNIICLGLNYRDHAEELQSTMGDQAQIPDAPVYFTKMASSIRGSMEEIDSHSPITREIDYEVELAIIIGKEGKNIKRDRAEEYIFGYSILNDLTARDLQKKHNQWMKGKSLDGFTAMGPWIVHKNKLPLPLNLNISAQVNGEVRQNSNTKNLIFDIAYIIEDLSKGMTLQVGDIIATGTPGGVGMGFEPPKYLKSGDMITCSIEGIGSLVNTIK